MRVWLQAFRPKTLSAAVIPVLVASALVYAEAQPVSVLVVVLCLLGALFIQIGTNLFNDAIDFKKGADTEARLGPQRVTQSGLIAPAQVMKAGALSFILALLCGIPLVYIGGWPIIVIGVASLLSGYLYTGGPYPLAYVGLGDLFVVFFFGVVAVGGTYFLHTSGWSFSALVCGLQVGLLATVLLAINNLRDIQQDKHANKRTLAVRFGMGFARREIVLLIAIAFGLNLFWLFQGYWLATLLPCVAIPLAIKLARATWNTPLGPVYNQFLAKAGALHVIFGVTLGLGLILVPH